MKTKSKRHNRKQIWIGIGIALLSVGIISGVSMIPDSNAEVDGLFSVPENFHIFNGLTLFPSSVLNCDLYQSVWYSDVNGKKFLVGVGHDDDFIPYQQLDVFSNSGNTVKTFDGELKTTCDSGFTSKIIDPSISGGIVEFTIKATNQQGKEVVVKTIQKNISTTPKSVNGKTETIATWSIPASEIEDKIKTSGSYNFKSTVTSTVVGTLKFKTFPAEKIDWKYAIKTGAVATFSLKIVSAATQNFIDNLASKDKLVELKLNEPSDGTVDLRTNERVRVTGSLYDWSQSEGYPVIKVYYNDPKASPGEKVNPVIQKTLTSFTGKEGKGGVVDFAFTYIPSSTSKLGQYKIDFSSVEKNGVTLRNTIGTVPVEYIKTTAGSSTSTNTTNEDEKKDDQTKEILDGLNTDFLKQLCAEVNSPTASVESLSGIIQSAFGSNSEQVQAVLGSLGSSQLGSLCSSGSSFGGLGNLNLDPNLFSSVITWFIIAIVFILIIAIAKSVLTKKPSMRMYPPGYGSY